MAVCCQPATLRELFGWFMGLHRMVRIKVVFPCLSLACFGVLAECWVRLVDLYSKLKTSTLLVTPVHLGW